MKYHQLQKIFDTMNDHEKAVMAHYIMGYAKYNDIVAKMLDEFMMVFQKEKWNGTREEGQQQ